MVSAVGNARFTAWEFFAGGGMARAGLGDGWAVTFANDFDRLKGETYAANWGGEHLRVEDVWALTPEDLPGRADLAWASSPCQDFSLAGGRAGLGGGRSSALLGFLDLMRRVEAEGRGPRTLVIENVVGLLSSNGGADFAGLCARLAADGWRFGAVEIDAAAFVPQSRPRLFMITARDAPPPERIGGPEQASRAVREAVSRLSPHAAAAWLWWRLPAPAARNADLASLLQPDAVWDAPERTERLLSLLSPLHRARVEAALSRGERLVGTAYRRVRTESGRKVQRAELRFDGVAGCLRTPAGGSSRQLVVEIADGRVRSRRLTAREGARLMGLADDYRLPTAETAAWRVIGDGVAVPAVRRLAEAVLEPLLAPASRAAA